MYLSNDYIKSFSQRIKPNFLVIKRTDTRGYSFGIGSDATEEDIKTINEWYDMARQNPRFKEKYPEFYRDWWIKKIKTQTPDSIVRKMEIDNKTITFTFMENVRKEAVSNQPRTFINGITATPELKLPYDNKFLSAVMDLAFRSKEFKNEMLAGNAAPHLKCLYEPIFGKSIRKSIDGIIDYYEGSADELLRKIERFLFRTPFKVKK